MNSKNLNRNVKAMILLIGLSSILFSNSVTAQSKFSSSGSGNAHLFEVSNNSHWVGLGAHPTDIDFSYFTPSAAFHIRLDSSDFPLYPLFKIDINQSLTDYGTLSFIFSYERHKLGIFQKGQDVSNIFEGLTFVGVYSSLFNSSKNGGFKFVTDGKGFFNDTLSLKRPLYFYHNENHQSGITWESTDPDDVFSFTNTDVRSNTIWYPLMLDPMLGVITHRLLQADSIKILKGAGLNKVLVSDAEGNGNWADASQFNDNDWLRNRTDDLYSNCRYVGIGTDSPEDKLQINSGCNKFTIGSAGGASLFWGTSYIGFNASRQNENWIISDDGSHNGGTTIYGDIFGNMYFITIPTQAESSGIQTFTDNEMLGMTKLTISNTGNVGIGTRNPIVTLDINTKEETIIRSYALGKFSSSIWAMNYLGGYSLAVDTNGLGHIYENAIHPNPVITFYNGKVGIGCSDFSNITSNHKLFVTGGITTEEVTVKLQTNWYDYIFSNTYILKPISELEKYIQTNHHLPDIPSESEIKTNGINLGEMNSLLLKKIEELTLYIIDQQKQISALQNALNH